MIIQETNINKLQSMCDTPDKCGKTINSQEMDSLLLLSCDIFVTLVRKMFGAEKDADLFEVETYS